MPISTYCSGTSSSSPEPAHSMIMFPFLDEDLVLLTILISILEEDDTSLGPRDSIHFLDTLWTSYLSVRASLRLNSPACVSTISSPVREVMESIS